MAKTPGGESVTLYSDTGYENEICYVSADYYDLDDPFNRLKLLRLTRAMSCFNCYEEPKKELGCRDTVCKAHELHGVELRERSDGCPLIQIG